MKDTLFTLSAPCEGFLKEKQSKFYAFVIPVNTVEEVHEQLTLLKKRFHDSRHVCYAYRLGKEGEIWRANDDGEPSHSAGDPILNALRSKEITNVVGAVVRYFGGTKLGVSGLIEAYRESTLDAINNGNIIEYILTKEINIEFAYDQTNEVNRVLQKFDLKPKSAEYLATCRQSFDIRESLYEQIKGLFKKMAILK